MPKLTKTDLARGAKLSSQHIENNLLPVDSVFFDTKLDTENLAETKVPFYVNFSFTTFKPDLMGLLPFQRENGVDGNLVFPIPLIPTQDHFSAEGRLTNDTPIYLLDSVSVSMDLRAEGAAMVNNLTAPPAGTPYPKSWKINYEVAGTQDIELALLQKDYKVLSDTSDYPTNSIFTTTIPATIAFAGSENRVENPYYVFGINKQINPYKSYYLAFNFPNQLDNEFWVNDLVISFKFYTILDTRSEEQSNTTNKSQENANSEITNYNLNLIPPIPYSTISAEDPTGLQTNLNKIDEAVEEKLTTGYGDKYGSLGSYEDLGVNTNQAISTPAVYDVLVVPMWQGTIGGSGAITTYWNFSGGLETSDVLLGGINPANYDYGVINDYAGPIQDIRTIPLFYPFTIHHVLAWHNEQMKTLAGFNYEEFGYGTQTGNVVSKIGVAIGTCFQADTYTYDQVALLEYDRNFANVIDEISMRNNAYNRDGILGVGIKTAGKLLQVPLVFGVDDGVGFYSQSVPYYCGGGTKRFDGRSGAPDNQGTENFIEIRWQFETDGTGWFDDIGTGKTPATIAGIGGHFVYLIGKKLLTTNRNNLQE